MSTGTPAINAAASASSTNSGNKNSTTIANTPITTSGTTTSTKVPDNEKTNNNNNNSSSSNPNNANNDIFNSDSNNSSSAAAILKAYREIVTDDKSLDEAVNYLYQSLLEDAVIGVYLEIHHLGKTGNLEALDGVPDEDAEASMRIVDMPNYDIFGMSTTKKPMDCTCPNCDRPVSAARFAPHLEKCMGMGRISSRIASRRLATKESTSASSSSSSSYLQTNAGTDDEDDVDWSSEKRRKKSNQNSRNNGSKKNNGKTF